MPWVIAVLRLWPAHERTPDPPLRPALAGRGCPRLLGELRRRPSWTMRVEDGTSFTVFVRDAPESSEYRDIELTARERAQMLATIEVRCSSPDLQLLEVTSQTSFPVIRFEPDETGLQVTVQLGDLLWWFGERYGASAR